MSSGNSPIVPSQSWWQQLPKLSGAITENFFAQEFRICAWRQHVAENKKNTESPGEHYCTFTCITHPCITLTPITFPRKSVFKKICQYNDQLNKAVCVWALPSRIVIMNQSKRNHFALGVRPMPISLPFSHGKTATQSTFAVGYLRENAVFTRTSTQNAWYYGT